jgi:preprotein translocase subunit SecD
MKKLPLISAICLMTMVGIAADSLKQSVFQLRLVSEKPSSLTEEVVLSRNNSEQKLQVQKDCLLDSSAIKTAEAVWNKTETTKRDASGGLELSTNVTTRVNIELTDAGAKKMEEITTQHHGQRIAIFVDSKIWSAPYIEVPITNGHFQISGSYSWPEAEAMVEKIRASIPK